MAIRIPSYLYLKSLWGLLFSYRHSAGFTKFSG